VETASVFVINKPGLAAVCVCLAEMRAYVHNVDTRHEHHRLIANVDVTQSRSIWSSFFTGRSPATRQIAAKKSASAGETSAESLRKFDALVSRCRLLPRGTRGSARLLATLHFPVSLCSLFNAARARAGHNKKSVKDLESYEVCTMGLSIARCKYSHFR